MAKNLNFRNLRDYLTYKRTNITTTTLTHDGTDDTPSTESPLWYSEPATTAVRPVVRENTNEDVGLTRRVGERLLGGRLSTLPLDSACNSIPQHNRPTIQNNNTTNPYIRSASDFESLLCCSQIITMGDSVLLYSASAPQEILDKRVKETVLNDFCRKFFKVFSDNYFMLPYGNMLQKLRVFAEPANYHWFDKANELHSFKIEQDEIVSALLKYINSHRDQDMEIVRKSTILLLFENGKIPTITINVIHASKKVLFRYSISD